ncbi:MAG: sigma-70 family RNA polymerase sigma factor [Kofleriaceae bacterium]
MQQALAHALLDELPELAAKLELGPACATVVETIGHRWPLDWIDGGTFGRYLARRVDPGIDLLSGLVELHVADLYLACAIARGVAPAIAAFDRMLTRELPGAIRTIDARPDVIDDVIQLLREKLLVPVDQTIRLDSYSGHGPLGAWLRVSALRIALSQKRRLQIDQDPDELDTILDLAPNAEVRVLARQLGGDLRAALRTAIAAQPARIRAVMRLYYADGRGVEDIGRVYSVHASTVSRWLAKARVEILEHTRTELTTTLNTPASQVDSLLGHAASLEISFESLLR